MRFFAKSSSLRAVSAKFFAAKFCKSNGTTPCLKNFQKPSTLQEIFFLLTRAACGRKRAKTLSKGERKDLKKTCLTLLLLQKPQASFPNLRFFAKSSSLRAISANFFRCEILQKQWHHAVFEELLKTAHAIKKTIFPLTRAALGRKRAKTLSKGEKKDIYKKSREFNLVSTSKTTPKGGQILAMYFSSPSFFVFSLLYLSFFSRLFRFDSHNFRLQPVSD